MLALAILNYGSRLETLITTTKSKGSLNYSGYGVGGDDSSSKRRRTLQNNDS